MAAPSTTTIQPKYALCNDSDGLRSVLSTSAFDKLIPSASTFVASSYGTKQIPYDVFINHHEKDTKHTVASRIYNSLDDTGLRVFLDKDELKLGDLLPKALEEAMVSASLHIAIFSEHYAQSPWCLAELEFMVKTCKTIIPIFYHVDPSDVRWVVRTYAEAFLEHEKKNRYNTEVLQRWKQTLHEVSFCIDEIIKNNDDEQRAVKNVVNRVMKEMKKVPLEVAKYPVGLDEAVQDFNTSALQSAGSMHIVAIWGMGGSGKTTLAKEIFNRRSSAMDWSSFLSDVRDADRKGQLLEKQKTLLKNLDGKDLDFDNLDKGKQILKTRLSRLVRVLIVLDDVDHVDQLDALLPPKESLGNQSLIIVTTRNANVLQQWGISVIYQMRYLNATHAEQLFCWHAFLQNSPPSEFEDLVKKFLNACKGLPLSLKVLGGQLYGRSDKDYWQRTFNKFSQIPHEDIVKRLKVSYDALAKQDKEMFLDTACLFIGHRKSTAIAVWDAEWDGLLGWETLFNKCLVEEDQNGFIRMHDHLRDLGRDIANEHSPHRLWSPQQVIETPPQQQTIRVRGMANAIGNNCYQRQKKIIINTSQGERSLAPCLLGLKIFVGSGDFINQEHSEISIELVWLQCNEFEHKSLPSWLSLRNIRILELARTWSLEYLWERDVDAPLQLRELVIQHCGSLRGFPKSIGRLTNLKKISVGDNYNIANSFSSLPQEFCHLQSLKYLEIKWCKNLSSLPSNFGELTNLQHLNLNGCANLEMLPDSLNKLTLLGYLNLEGCSELMINSELHILENMTKLRYLNVAECKKLEELRLPEVASLTELYLTATSLKELPTYICKLTKLTELQIGSEFLTTLPNSVGNLSSLTTFKIYGCEKLESLPDSLEHLNFLRDLYIEDSGVKCLPKSLIHLQSLGIRETPISKLSFGSGCMLKRIDLHTTKVSRISICEDFCPFLETLSLYSNKDLREIETLPGTLKTIHIFNCKLLTDIRGVRGLKKLQYLQICWCGEINGLPCFAELASLEIFKLKGSSKVKKIGGLQELRSLRELSIELDELPSFAEFTSLQKFELQRCNKLEKVQSLEHLKSLEELNISDCPELEALPSLRETTSLQEFQLEKCHKLEKIEGLGNISLKKLRIYDCPALGGLPSLAELTSLKEFDLQICHKLKKIEGLGNIRSLEKLKITDCPELKGLPSLAELTSLKEFDLEMCYELEKVEGFGNIRSLEKLKISDCPKLDGLPSLAKLTYLKEFYLEMCNKLEKVEGFGNLRSLEKLKISDCPELDGLLSLEELASLKEFDLHMCHKLEKIKGLESLRSLERLRISNCPQLDVLLSLAELASLKRFNLKTCPNLKKLRICNCPQLEGLLNFAELTSLRGFDLERCPKLENLWICNCPQLDVLSLAELTSLKGFYLERCSKLKKIEGSEHVKSLEELNISDCPELEALPSLPELTYLKKLDLKNCHKLEKIDGLERVILLERLELHTLWNAPCIVSLKHSERLESLVVVANHISAVEPFVGHLQEWPRKVMICTRTVCDVGSLKNLFEELLNISVLDCDVEEISEGYYVKFWSPESSANVGAILICLIIDCVYPDIDFGINLGRRSAYFKSKLGKGKWVWMGVFTQPSEWFWSNDGYFSAYDSRGEYVKVEVEEAWSLMGEEGSIVEAFHQLLKRELCLFLLKIVLFKISVFLIIYIL